MSRTVKFEPWVPLDDSAWMRFYDSDWGCFYVTKADLVRAFGTSDFGENDLEIVDPMGTAQMRMHVAWDRTWAFLSQATSDGINIAETLAK